MFCTNISVFYDVSHSKFSWEQQFISRHLVTGFKLCMEEIYFCVNLPSLITNCAVCRDIWNHLHNLPSNSASYLPFLGRKAYFWTWIAFIRSQALVNYRFVCPSHARGSNYAKLFLVRVRIHSDHIFTTISLSSLISCVNKFLETLKEVGLPVT